MKKRMITLMCLLLVWAAGALAQHWTVNPHAFQYDMTAYVSIKGMTTAQQLADYELAAFCGDECRGVGKVLTATDGTGLFQLRIRSNVTTGESITFRVYQKSMEKEFFPDAQMDFEAQSVAGTPSEPVAVTISRKGDANGDGTVDVNDITATVNSIQGDPSTTFVREAADVNGDGIIDVNDITGIVNIIQNQ